MKHLAWNRLMPLILLFLGAAVTASLVGCSLRRGPEETKPPGFSRELVTIRDIICSEERDYTRVTIDGSRELLYDSLEVLEDPLRISVGIPNASLDVLTPIPVNNGTVTEIVATADGDRRSIEIGLVDRVDYNMTQEANRLYIDIDRIQRTKPVQVERPAVAEEIETLAARKPATALTDVSVIKGEETTEVVIRADGVIGDYNTFTLESPPRLVIDLWKLKKLFPRNVVSAETPHLKRLRIGKHPDKTRLVLDTSGSKVPPHRIDRFQDELIVLLGHTEVLKRGGAGMLSGVDFKQIDNKSRVVLSSSERVDFEVFKVSEKDVVVDLKKTTAPKNLKRALHTHAFDSAVDSIRLYNVRSETSRDVRVVIHLREMVGFEAHQEDLRIFVDFDKPAKRETKLGGNPGHEEVAELDQPKNPETAPEEEEVEAKSEEKPVNLEPNAEETSAANMTEETDDSSEKTGTASSGEIAEGGKQVLERQPPEVLPPAEEVTIEDKQKPVYELAIAPGKQYTGRRLSLDFKDADIKNILRLIAEVSNLNVVAGEDVKGKVTIRLIDVPWDQALDIVLFSNNLGKMRMGNVIRVAPVEALKREEEEALSARRNKEKLEDLVTELIPVNYSSAQELQTQVKNILSDRGSISIDTRTNTLVIKDIPRNIMEARRLVQTLDTRTPQVIIEARIVEASTNFSRELGIKWGGTLPPQKISGTTTDLSISGGIGTDTVANFPVANPTSAITFSLANMGDITNLDIELTAMESAGEGNIISAPRITTLDNKEASVEQGLRIPYLKLTAEGTATTDFIEANIKLSVTPHVTADGHIKMNIKASKDTPDTSITVQGVPAIDKKEAITEVLVEDGDVVVIAGIYSIEKTDKVERVPLLGKVPVLGFLFKKTEKTDDRRDLLIFISPRIIQERA